MRSQITWVVALTLIASPAITFGAENTTARPELQLKNVELTATGSLEGRILTPTGTPVKGVQLSVRSQKDVQQVGQKVVTDEAGRFLITGLKTGTCIVSTEDNTFAVRAWNKGTAPPKSLKRIALIQESSDTVRGNWASDNRFVNWVRCLTPQQKCCLGVIVAAAIAIPIALDDDGS